MKEMRQYIEDRCEKVTESGCWIWMGATKMGYGSFRRQFRGKTQDAHRAAYEAFVGEIPAGLWVLHRCDVRPCCNPSHLFAGTRQDNIADAMTKGRLRGITRKRPSGLKYNWTKKPGPKPKALS